MTLPDVAVPVARARPGVDHLRWVLRTVEAHLPHGRVYCAGPLQPKWLTGVEWVTVPEKSAKHENIGANLAGVLASDISETFYWFNDDIFCLRDMRAVLLHHRATSFDHWYQANKEKHRGPSDHWSYIGGMCGQWEVMAARGLPTDANCDLHVPIPIVKTRCAEIVDSLPAHLAGHFRAVYGAGLPSTPLDDPKIKNPVDTPPDDWPFLSVSPGSWSGAAGDWIRARYPTPSKYEMA